MSFQELLRSPAPPGAGTAPDQSYSWERNPVTPSRRQEVSVTTTQEAGIKNPSRVLNPGRLMLGPGLLNHWAKHPSLVRVQMLPSTLSERAESLEREFPEILGSEYQMQCACDSRSLQEHWRGLL